MSIPSLSSTVLGTIYTPRKQDSGLLSTRNLALGGIAATTTAAGGIIGKLSGHPLLGAGIGAAIGAVAIGAALLGSASDSYYYDDYPSGGSRGGRSYPSGGSGGHTSPGDDYGSGGSGGSGGSHSSGNSTDNGNPSESDF
jgi:hypothetical protein